MEKLVFGWEMVRIETMQRQTDYLEILISPTTASAVCPLCEQSSARVHSAYQRSLRFSRTLDENLDCDQARA